MQKDAGIKQAIRDRALAEGFDAVRFGKAQADPANALRLSTYLSQGHHGEMEWMEERSDWRANPKALWPLAQSIIILGLNYGPQIDPLRILEKPDRGAISVYAQGDDYHEVVKKKLKAVASFIFGRFDAQVKVFVDTAPVMEKPLAQKAGLGWQGKHTNLVSREFGSWLFLGSIFTTLDMSADEEETDHCGTCQACVDVCPTKAFPAPYQLDARRCISYLTIEHKGPIGREFRTAIGNRIYGCDDCLAVCPWNKFATTASEIKLGAREALKQASLCELADLDEAGFLALFHKSPIKRIGRNRFLRNVMIAIGNSGRENLASKARKSLRESSPVVRGAAVWALSRLLYQDEFSNLARQEVPLEHDETVRSEWSATAE